MVQVENQAPLVPRRVKFSIRGTHGIRVQCGSSKTVSTENRAILDCVTERAAPGLARRSLQVRQWTFDAAVCDRVRMEVTPSVNARAPHELRHLLSAS